MADKYNQLVANRLIEVEALAWDEDFERETDEG